MKHHIVSNGAYYYAELVGSNQTYWGNTLQYRSRVGDLFIPERYLKVFPTRLEAYRYMYHNIINLTDWWSYRRICYSYQQLTRILHKHYPEDFL